MKKKKGFTLIELLVVIGILVILMAAAIVAINPLRQFAIANNANRWSGVTTIMNAVYQNIVDNRGVFVCSVDAIPTGTPEYVWSTTTPGGNIAGCLIPTYLATMPVDPQGGIYTSTTSYNTGYNIYQNPTTSRITICASTTQNNETICTTR